MQGMFNVSRKDEPITIKATEQINSKYVEAVFYAHDPPEYELPF